MFMNVVYIKLSVAETGGNQGAREDFFVQKAALRPSDS